MEVAARTGRRQAEGDSRCGNSHKHSQHKRTGLNLFVSQRATSLPYPACPSGSHRSYLKPVVSMAPCRSSRCSSDEMAGSMTGRLKLLHAWCV